ncbi:hypothetical protein [Clostridium perfringens]|uniref:hypothetical protein n=1 Tax=Clostridium perfringens TaxID=1502 RepID=UPI0024BC63DE|nr:hypothetical protein [Clostridium perfringens]
MWRCKMEIKAFGDDKVTIFAQIPRSLYKQVRGGSVVYPVEGVSCAGANGNAERALSNKLGFNFFFAWENLDDVEQMKGKLYYTNDNNSKYVLIKIVTDRSNTIRTDYYNYADIIYFTDGLTEEEINSDKFLDIVEAEIKERKSLEDLVNDALQVEEGRLVQVLYKYLDRAEIEFVNNLSDIRV